MTPVKKVCVITGGTSGIGLCTAQAMLEKGYTVYELSRRAEGAPGMKHIMADVTKEETLAAAVQEILKQEDHIDVLINNAGFGISGPVEFTSLESAHRQFDVNFFGAMTCIQAVLPHMRQQGYGRILCVSSVAAVLSIPFQSFYSAAKAALNALVLALANEVRPHNIQVAALMPGDIRTGFTAAREKTLEGAQAYPALIPSVARMEQDEANGMDPGVIARRLYQLSRKGRLKPLYSAGLQYQLFVLLQKLLPCRLINWLVGRLYAK